MLATMDCEGGGALVRFGRGRVGNVAHVGLGWLSENVDKVREVLAELWVGRCWLWCSGELTRARRSKWQRRWLSQRLRHARAKQMEQGHSRGERAIHLWPDSECPCKKEADTRRPRVEHALTPVGSGESEFFIFELH